MASNVFTDAGITVSEEPKTEEDFDASTEIPEILFEKNEIPLLCPKPPQVTSRAPDVTGGTVVFPCEKALSSGCNFTAPTRFGIPGTLYLPHSSAWIVAFRKD